LSEEPEPITTTEAPPPPPPLSRILPFADEGLQLVQIEGSAAIGTWGVDAAAPGFWANIGQADSAAYNVDGSYLAVLSRVRNGSITITDGAGYNPIYLQGDIWAGSWHPTDPSLYAWTKQLESEDGSASVLMAADLSGYTGTTVEPLVELPLADGPHLILAWGDWGFVTADWSGESGPVVTALDSDGLNPLELEGDFFGATADGALLMARLGDSGYMPYLVEPDRTETALVGLDIGAADFRMTSDGAWVIAVTQQADGHTSILARTVRSRSTRLTSINEPARIVNLSTDNRYIILQEAESQDLVFKDWSSGAEHRVPIDGGTVAAVFLP
jgi:hypothetical protein